MTLLNGGDVTDEVYNQLCAPYSPKQVADLSIAVAEINACCSIPPVAFRNSPDRPAAGLEVSTAADHLKMAIQTARFNLKSISWKTGTYRQANPVRLALNLPEPIPISSAAGLTQSP